MGPVEGQEEAPSASTFLWDAGMDLTCEQCHVRCKRRKHSRDQPPPPACTAKPENKTKNPSPEKHLPKEGFHQQFYWDYPTVKVLGNGVTFGKTSL